MITMYPKAPGVCTIAVSGGPDSMGALSFLANKNKRTLDVLYINHGTPHAKEAQELVSEYCNANDLPLTIKTIEGTPSKNQSQEEFWSIERNKIFQENPNAVITAHNLDDCMEWWIMTSIHGNPRLIPDRNNNILRLFLLTSKIDFISWCENNNVDYIIDPSNKVSLYDRNYVRNELMPKIIKLHPGFRKVIKKKLLERKIKNG